MIFNYFGALAALISGVIAGWLINYLADVLPVYRKLTRPICPHCGEPVTWKKSFSYGICPKCQKSANFRHLIIQFFLPAISLALYLFPPEKTGYFIGVFLCVYLCVVLVIDIEHRAILNQVSLFGAFAGFIVGILLHDFTATLLGGVSGFGIMLILYYFGVLFIKLLGKAKQDADQNEEVALGFGDVYLSGILGLILGWPGITAGLLLAIVMGGLVSGGFLVITLIKRSYRPLVAIPYAPFLICAALFLLFFPFR
jgi:prepilin signal peptidase PulO-like enzyme (type II secretory pathway)